MRIFQSRTGGDFIVYTLSGESGIEENNQLITIKRDMPAQAKRSRFSLACFARRLEDLYKKHELLSLRKAALSLSQTLGFVRSNSNRSNMFLTRTEYDRGVNTFSPEGRLFQVEYAIEAIKLGSTAIGIKTKDGVVLAVEKRITSPLLEPSSVEKIMEIDEHIGCAMSGLIADARTLVEHARVETQNHRFSYGEPMTVESTTQALCDLALRFGEGDEESMSRPFGVSLLIAGHDENGPSL
ncbi:proteasome subunit alpha type-5 isoform X1 [Herrania umbratica]|uniref:Proteasome subunit alpha type n=2 Tax=Herrania umbratica TaxID=108875 RepID=A0A6J1B5T5_9ROSI|nr:proteasome subunit alpha type-5 isoform X1 [Herrania umbratica]